MTLSNIKLHYFDIGSRGYGQIVRYFLQDNNISYEDIRFKHEDWPAKREEMIAANKTPAATAPYVETADGACYGRTLPILRRLTKTIPALKFENDDEEYYADYAADVAYDWYSEYVYAAYYEDFKKKYEDRYAGHFDKMERIYAKNSGPYILGEKICYVDYLVYHCVHGNNAFDLIQRKYPALAKFVAAFKERPNLKNYLANPE